MTTINLSLVTHIVALDRQIDIYYGSSIVTVTGNNSSISILGQKIIEADEDGEKWIRLDDANFTSVNVFPLGSAEPHYK